MTSFNIALIFVTNFVLFLSDEVVADITRSDNLELSIIHLNDFHARFEETNLDSGICKEDEECIGGFSRVYTAVRELLNERPNAIFLNAGDNYQGTLWYNLFRWNVTQLFLNMLPTDALTLGNHEFDHGIEVANIDDSLEPTMQGLYEKSTIIERDGRKIGIVGVMLSTTNLIAATENLRFLDESASVNAEARRLLDEEGVFTVIVLSHSGYDVDQRIAANATSGISVIVGAHSHTLLYTGTPPLGSAYGEYPTVVYNPSNERVLIVQASAYTKYLGNLSVEYDGNGKLITWDGNPIYLDQSVPQDPYINELLEPYRLVVEEVGNTPLGTSKVHLNQTNCRYSECNLGNFMTDAMVAYYANNSTEDTWTKAAIGMVNAGGIRTSIGAGVITYNDLATSSPFGNTVDYAEIQGKDLKDLIETAASPYSSSRVTADVNLLQVSGIRFIIDLSRPLGSRVVSLKVRCHKCKVPAYSDIDLEAYYPIAVLSFLLTGGDGFSAFANVINHEEGPIDTDVYTAYIEQQSPVIAGLDERIQIISDTEVRVVYHAN
ncbi:5prime-nucleotidase, C-terminal domain [Popillia japonica]|uniref:5prime-nucleotidase, C-terminal domain n=1 Tax=Popillia japonica TaxID=7064 RepID=A0AAW1K0N5_POPJA